MTLQVSRGCPFHCNLCSIITMLGNDMRYKTPEAVIRELEPIYETDIMGRISGRPIFMVDDNIYGNPKEFKKLLRAISKLNQRYPKFKPFFGSQLTINVTRDKEALELMQEAGFGTAFIGLESLDRNVLRSFEKHHNVGFDYDEAVETLRHYGIEVIASFIFGRDVEGSSAFDEAFDFFDRNNIVYPYFNIHTPGRDSGANSTRAVVS